MTWAKNSPDAPQTAQEITLRVFNYVHVNPSTLRAAEGETTRILVEAGVNARWVDCPTPHDNWDDYPNCQSAWRDSDYVLRVMPKAMVAVLENSTDSLGFAPDCGTGPHCMAGVFYDRVMSLAGGANAAAPVLLGRVMAHEIGHLLLGPNSHSRTGIMRANWSAREFRLDARPELLFTAEQSRRMKTRIAEQVQPSQAQTKVVNLGRR